MWDDWYVMQRGNGTYSDQLGDATTPLRVGLDYGKGAGLEVALYFPSAVKVLARGDGDGGAAADGGETLNLFGVRNLFHPVGAVLFHPVGPIQSVVLIPSALCVEHDLGIVTEGFTENADQFDILLHTFRPGAGAVAHEPLLIAETFALERERAGAHCFPLKRKAEATGVHLH